MSRAGLDAREEGPRAKALTDTRRLLAPAGCESYASQRGMQAPDDSRGEEGQLTIIRNTTGQD